TPPPRSMCRGDGSSASCVNGCQMDSGLADMKIFRVKIVAKLGQQLFTIHFIEPGNPAYHGNSGEMLNGEFVLSIAVADHHDAFDAHFCTAQGPDREQSMVDRAERRSRSD